MMSLRRWLTAKYDWTGLSGKLYKSLPLTIIAFVLALIGVIYFAFIQNFELEKLLSSSDTQIVHYSLEPGHPLKAHHRDKSAEESACVESRTAIQEGAIRYARDARDVRTRLYPDFRPSCTMARQIYEAFMTGQTTQERDLLRAIALDDHYCGREVVC